MHKFIYSVGLSCGSVHLQEVNVPEMITAYWQAHAGEHCSPGLSPIMKIFTYTAIGWFSGTCTAPKEVSAPLVHQNRLPSTYASQRRTLPDEMPAEHTNKKI
jgi:hypothetical protein